MLRLTLCLLLAACAPDAPPASSGPRPALVRLAPVEAGDLTESWVALGDVRPLSSADLAAGAAGPVHAVLVREGERVERGDVLLEVDRAPALARLASAEAAAAQASVELGRLREALRRRERVQQGVLAEEELNDSRAAVAAQVALVDALEATALEARTALGRHRVRAPFAGAITARQVDPGDWVTLGQPVLSLVSDSAVEVHVRVPADVARSLPEGATAALSGGGTASVVRVVPALDPASRTVLVRLAPTEGTRLLAGDAVDVSLPVPFTGGVKVPRDALRLEPGSASVLKREGESVAIVPVDILATADEHALVRGTLQEGDLVVTRGNERARPGQPIVVEGEGS